MKNLRLFSIAAVTCARVTKTVRARRRTCPLLILLPVVVALPGCGDGDGIKVKNALVHTGINVPANSVVHIRSKGKIDFGGAVAGFSLRNSTRMETASPRLLTTRLRG
jgi:hypothetical protein